MHTVAAPDLPSSLPHDMLDVDAIDVCRRLQDAGFETYLVGGCVRDVLLGREPKDFDVGTMATPNQVRRLFRHSRLIGRRFRLVHVLVGPKIIEVATFRGAGEDEGDEGAADGHEVDDDGFVRRANVFGGPEEDARSRDFPINALFYDPVARRIIDHVGGYPDIVEGVIRTIGDPVARFQEDPVRILRAVKFSARLGFRIDEPTMAAMAIVAPGLAKCPVARVTEEIYRIAESGYFRRAVEVMHETNVLGQVLPEVAEAIVVLGERYIDHLEQFDRASRAHGGLPRELVLTLMLMPLVEPQIERLDPTQSGRFVEEWITPIGVRMHIAVRHRLFFRGLVTLVRRMLSPRRAPRLSPADRRLLPMALTVVRLLHRRDGVGRDAYLQWRRLAIEAGVPWVPTSPEPPPEYVSASVQGRRAQR